MPIVSSPPILVKRKYYKLRAHLADYDLIFQDVATKLGKSLGYVSQRFMGQRSWEIDDCYTILDWLQIDRARITEYFPKGGVTE